MYGQRAPKKIDKDLRLNHYFIDFDYKHNAEELLRAYAHFFNELGRFPGSLEFATVPNFINTSEIIYLGDLHDRFRASEAR